MYTNKTINTQWAMIPGGGGRGGAAVRYDARYFVRLCT